MANQLIVTFSPDRARLIGASVEAKLQGAFNLNTTGTLTIWSDDAAGLRALARACQALAERLDPTPVIQEAAA